MPLSGYAPGAPERGAHRVVEQESGADVGTLPRATRKKQQEGERADEMRREAIEHAGPFVQGLADEAELEMFQVAQPAVDQFARAARCPGGEIARLDESDPQPAGRGVQSNAAADHAAPDDRDVEHLVRHPRQRPTALLWVKGSAVSDRAGAGARLRTPPRACRRVACGCQRDNRRAITGGPMPARLPGRNSQMSHESYTTAYLALDNSIFTGGQQLICHWTTAYSPLDNNIFTTAQQDRQRRSLA